MGAPPPPDAPAPEIQDANAAAAALPAAPSGISICGFAIPGPPPFPTFSIPFPSFSFPPSFPFPLPMLCDLANSIADEFGPGGGREGVDDLEKDPED